tara:strand:- start:76 stop:573 length:498 start_codon:yes stop_codon:yes gene_type:complete
MKKLLYIFLGLCLFFACSDDDNENNNTQAETYFQRLLEYSTYQVENSSNYYKFSSLTNQTDLTHEHYYLDSINQNCWLIEVYNGSFNETGNIRYEVDYGYDYLNYSQIFDDGSISYITYNYTSIINENGDVSYVMTVYDSDANVISVIERNWFKVEELPSFNMCD